MTDERRFGSLPALAALLTFLLLACCPAPTAGAETAFTARVESLSLSYAGVILADGRPLRLSLGSEEEAPAGLVEGSRVYVEGVFGDGLVIVRRLALLPAEDQSADL